MLGNISEAEDLTQEAFLQLFPILRETSGFSEITARRLLELNLPPDICAVPADAGKHKRGGRFNSRSLLAVISENPLVSRRIGFLYLAASHGRKPGAHAPSPEGATAGPIGGRGGTLRFERGILQRDRR